MKRGELNEHTWPKKLERVKNDARVKFNYLVHNKIYTFSAIPENNMNKIIIYCHGLGSNKLWATRFYDDLLKNKIFITSQNHGYVVDRVPEAMEVTHINLNDNSIEGMRSKELRIMCVQYHPEAWPGPSDSDYLFDDFLDVIEGK